MNDYIEDDYEDGEGSTEGESVRYFCRFTFGQFFTLFLLGVITIVFVFYLGARYGTNYLRIADTSSNGPNVIQVTGGAHSALPPELSNDPELARLAREVRAANQGESLEERLKELLEKQKNGEPSLAAKELPPPLPTESVGTAKLLIPNSNHLETPDTEEVATLGNQPLQTTDSADSLQPSPNAFAVQVGSYQDLKEASYWVEEWKVRGYPAYMMIADIPDKGRWYRVRIGGFQNRPEADIYLAQLKSHQQTDAIVVLNEQ